MGKEIWRRCGAALFIAILVPVLVSSFAQARPTAEALYDGLLKANVPSPPAGFSSPTITAIDLSPIERDAGMVGAVQVTLSENGRPAQVRYYVFREPGAAITYNNQHLGLPAHAGKLLPYPPFAQCLDRGDGGYCDMLTQDDTVVTTALASRVDGATAPLLGFGYQHLNAVSSALASIVPPPPKIGGLDPCGVVTKAEIEAALGGPAGPPQADRAGGCHWGSMRVAGDGVTVQSKEGGRSSFSFDRGRMSSATPLPGIGDDAFAFVSLAGFVQLNLLRNDHHVVIILQAQRDPARLEKAKTLAAEIAGRL
jgi:hypothetical protein